MYRKGLLTFILAICLAGMANLQAQSVSPNTSSSSAPEQCTSITDVVDREICLAEQAIARCNQALANKALTKSETAHWLQIRNSQQEKIQRFQKLNDADRQKMQHQYDLSEQARKAAQSR